MEREVSDEEFEAALDVLLDAMGFQEPEASIK